MALALALVLALIWMLADLSVCVRVCGARPFTGNHCIRVFGADDEVRTLAGSGIAGFSEGIGAQAQFHSPMSVAVHPKGIIYVADAGNHRIRAVADDGAVTTLAGSSESKPRESSTSLDGKGISAYLDTPTALAYDAKSGFLYVADVGPNIIRIIDVRDGTRRVALQRSAQPTSPLR
jgi:DNA-binding beta-propeller fold protein YncE